MFFYRKTIITVNTKVVVMFVRLSGICVAGALLASCSGVDLAEIGFKAAKGMLNNACSSFGNCSNVCPDGTEARPPTYSCEPGIRRPELDRPKGL